MKYSWILILFLASSGIAAGQQPKPDRLVLSLKKAVELALSPEGNTQLQLSEEALKQAKARSGQARAALLPDVSSSLIYRNQTVNLRAFGIGFFFPFPVPSLVGPFNVMDARIA